MTLLRTLALGLCLTSAVAGPLPPEKAKPKDADKLKLPETARHIWQRVTYEACIHLAEGRPCSTFATMHHDEFEQFKDKLEANPLFTKPTELCSIVEKEYAIIEKSKEKSKEEYSEKFCHKNFQQMYLRAKTEHIKFVKSEV